jgi:hypothetical protein
LRSVNILEALRPGKQVQGEIERRLQAASF